MAAAPAKAPEGLVAVRVLAWVLGLAPAAMMIGGGLVLIAAAAILPPWLELQQAGRQLTLMQEQAAALAERSDRYQAFLMELEAGEPALMERLAHTQLRLQPAGRQPLEADGGALEATADVAAWLDVPLPDAGRLDEDPRPIASRLERLVLGPARHGVLIAGGIFIACGLCWGRGPEASPKPGREAAPIGQIAGPYALAGRHAVPSRARRAG
ncbi:hypothetical protein [Phycisphaera mikurensis]|uniref:Uncharacterized protein n=1 Tax=Phycisphaera mikurensis (strain NBRC 102666 / KCTC 22515 / FYK2301M01) TaxID=1142394 RepID=I0IER6_PHYMF|nr:hypothetical protein [Phycisphaera mikurensis]MBB6441549.1 hypothetical protein [Phycisphaera mikurensis]BAM03754.1 hypothetical protein PSMK_15950 [Phycisphaera mikurensis NBRC 102666]